MGVTPLSCQGERQEESGGGEMLCHLVRIPPGCFYFQDIGCVCENGLLSGKPIGLLITLEGIGAGTEGV